MSRPAFAYLPRDLGHAVRSLAKARGFSFAAIVSLGIGLGVVIAMLMMMRLLIGMPPGFTREGLVELLVIPDVDKYLIPIVVVIIIASILPSVIHLIKERNNPSEVE